jgi:hypothetical protein
MSGVLPFFCPILYINGLVCETLHPNNPVAKLYNQDFTEPLKNKYIIEMNHSIQSDNREKYKKIMDQLSL